MQHFTDEKLRQLAAQAEDCSENRILALIEQLDEKIDRLNEMIPVPSKRAVEDDQAVKS
jgi:hypothetical protein